MATYYASGALPGSQPRKVHAGVNTVVSTVTFGTSPDTTGAAGSATAAASDVIRFVKMPRNATITRVAYTASRDDGAFDLGTSATGTLFADSASALTTLAESTTGLPHEVSVSDADVSGFDYLLGTITTAGATAGDTITVICEYVVDN